MGIFDNFSIDQFAGGLSTGIGRGTQIAGARNSAEARRKQAENAQKLAEGRLKLQQKQFGLQQDSADLSERRFGLQEEQFRTNQTLAAEDRELAQQDRDKQTTADLQRALSIQDAIDAQRRTGGLTEQQIAQINAAGGAEEQSALLNALSSTNQAEQANAPLRQLEQQRLQADIGATEALTAQRQAALNAAPAGPDAPADVRLLEALGLEPTLENFTKLKTAGSVQGNQAAPKVLGGDQRLVSASGEVLYEPPAKVGPDATTKQINDASKANTSFKTVDDSLTKLDALIAENGAEVAPGKVKDEMERLQADVLLELKELKNLGVLNGPDLDILKTQLVSPTPEGFGLVKEGVRLGIETLFGGDSLADRSRASIANLRESSRTRRDAVAAEAGITPDDAGAGAGQFNLKSSTGVKYRVVQ